jgi:GNAT superfamily N-acetyltransferase
MALMIRAADLARDRELIIETLQRYLTPLSDSARYEWLYCGNPYGQAVAWIASDESSGETVGMASAFPRRVILGGTGEPCWVLGDFCVHPRYRSLGPALMLNRACLSGVDRGTVAFCYDFPSERMMAIYRRLGIEPYGWMTRFAKVLRWGPKLGGVTSTPWLRKGLEILGGIRDRWSAPRPTAPPGVTLSLETAACGQAFDELDRTRERSKIHLERSSSYLNWRYRANPLGRYEFLTARRGDQVLGYAIFGRSDSDAILADLFALEEPITRALLDGVASIARERGAVTLSAPALSSHPLVPHLLRSGFRPRERYPVILYGRRNAERALAPAGGDWPFLHGDRDS